MHSHADMHHLQLGAGRGFLLQSLFVQLVQELAVDLDGGGTLELETGGDSVSKDTTRRGVNFC